MYLYYFYNGKIKQLIFLQKFRSWCYRFHDQYSISLFKFLWGSWFSLPSKSCQQASGKNISETRNGALIERIK